MKRTVFNIATVICFLLLLAASCKKTSKTTASCTSTIHAFTAPSLGCFLPAPYACSHGIINPSTGTIATAGTFPQALPFTTQATFNTSDNCYYLFQMAYGGYNLFKIDAAGVQTTLTPTDAFHYSAIAYNHVTNKLYSRRNGFLVQITAGTSTYSTTALVAPAHPFADTLASGAITVDNTTGDMYFLTGVYPNYYVEKYHPGASATTIVTTVPTGFPILDLNFNKADNMLYAMRIKNDSFNSEFIKINPAAGTYTFLADLGPTINTDIYSAALDPCSNRYIISKFGPGIAGPSAGPSCVLLQLNMSGAIVQHDSTATFYQGLDVAY
jgi:hypothetical protein